MYLQDGVAELREDRFQLFAHLCHKGGGGQNVGEEIKSGQEVGDKANPLLGGSLSALRPPVARQKGGGGGQRKKRGLLLCGR